MNLPSQIQTISLKMLHLKYNREEGKNEKNL